MPRILGAIGKRQFTPCASSSGTVHASSVTWNSTYSEYVTSQPVNTTRGSAIFLHINGSGSTAGCVSLGRTNLINVLKWLGPVKKPRIVMAPLADIGLV